VKISLQHVLILAVSLVCAAGSVKSSTQPFTLSLETEQNVVKARSEVKVNVTLRNSSNQAIDMSSGSEEIDYAIDVRDSQGGLAPDTDFARKLKRRPYYSSEQVFSLKPGESLPKATLSITKFYDLSRPGKYTIQVSRAVPKELGGGTIKSNTITVTVSE